MESFVELLKRRFNTKRVHINIVYQEYISWREHTHMNSTQWETLTDFAKWLGKEGEYNLLLSINSSQILYICTLEDSLRTATAEAVQ